MILKQTSYISDLKPSIVGQKGRVLSLLKFGEKKRGRDEITRAKPQQYKLSVDFRMDNLNDDSEERQVRNIVTFMNQSQKVTVRSENHKTLATSQQNQMNQFRSQHNFQDDQYRQQLWQQKQQQDYRENQANAQQQELINKYLESGPQTKKLRTNDGGQMQNSTGSRGGNQFQNVGLSSEFTLIDQETVRNQTLESISTQILDQQLRQQLVE